MCRGKGICNLLGTDPANWSKSCPLPPPEHFKQAFLDIQQIKVLLTHGKNQEVIEILQKPLGDEIREWFVEHAQNAWSLRFRGLGRTKDLQNLTLRDPKRLTNGIKEEVASRDEFKCQYCHGDLVPDSDLISISSLVGSDIFRITGNNQERHGYMYILRATADHVVPLSKGGKTELSNLVACCWACNYGKAEKTLNEIGLMDPRINA